MMCTKSPTSGLFSSRSTALALEPRVLLDAALSATLAEGLDAPDSSLQNDAAGYPEDTDPRVLLKRLADYRPASDLATKPGLSEPSTRAVNPTGATVTGAIELVAAPADVTPGALEDNTRILLFQETSGRTTASLAVDIIGPGIYDQNSTPATGSSIPLDTPLTSYLIHLDSSGTWLSGLSGSITFDQPILGIQYTESSLSSSDPLFGVSTTSYPATGLIERGALDANPDIPDEQIEWAADNRTLNITLGNDETGMDHIRVLVAATENLPPSAMALDSNYVTENAPNGTLVGGLSVTDDDPSGSHSYHIISDSSDPLGGRNGAFAIDGDQLVVGNGSLLDYEAQWYHSLTIKVVDGAGQPYEAFFTIYLNDQPEINTWTGGGGDADWFNINNWSESRIPTYSDGVEILTNGPVHIAGTLMPLNRSYFGSAEAGSLTLQNASLNISGGYLYLHGSGTIQADGSLVMTDGGLSHQGDLQLFGSFYWSGGSLGGWDRETYQASSFILEPGSQMLISDGAPKTLDNRLINRGSDARFSASDTFSIGWNGRMENDGHFTLSGENRIQFGLETGVEGYRPADQSDSRLSTLPSGFFNSGTLIRESDLSLGPAGTTTLEVPFYNQGLVEVRNGLLSFAEGFYQQSGETRLHGGGILGPTYSPLYFQGGLLTGGGDIGGDINTAEASGSLEASLAPGITAAALGRLSVSGDWWMNPTTRVSLDLGGSALGDYDQISVGNAVEFNGSLDLSLRAGYQPSGGERLTLMDYISHNGQFSDFTPPSLAGSIWELVYNPTDLQLEISLLHISNKQLNEETAGAIVGDVSVADPQKRSYSYSVDHADFEVVAGQLKLKDTLSADFETQPSYQLSLTATDTAAPERILQRQLVIDVTDLNEAPSAIQLSNTLLPEETPGKSVGELSVTDPDPLDSHSFTLSDSRFEVVTSATAAPLLKLVDGASIDYETEPSVSLTITATDSGGESVSADFILTILDLNEPPTDLTLSNLTVKENDPGAEIGSLLVTDPDAHSSYLFTVDDPRFEINGDLLKLKPGVSLDYETSAEVQLQITATENSTAVRALPHSITRTFTLQVIDLNEPPTALEFIGEGSIPENHPGWFVSGLLQVADPDLNDRYLFELSDSRFEVVGVTGGYQIQLQPGQVLDYETEASIPMRIRATDAAGQWIENSFTFSVTDRNEAPSLIQLDHSQVDENQPGAIIGNLAVLDPDAQDRHSFALSDSRFEVVDQQLKLKSGVSLNYEASPAINLSVTATDAGGLGLTQVFRIDVGDVNEAPLDILLDGTSLPEHTPGAAIGNLFTSDPDINDHHSYSLSDSRFEVVGNQLRLAAGVSLDATREPRIQLAITATDAAGLSLTKTFTLLVSDLNQPPTAITLDNAEVNEATPGAVVGNLSVADPDELDSHRFTLTDPRFVIENGVLKLHDQVSLDYETEPLITLGISAIDTGGLSLLQQFTIKVLDLVENHPPTAILLDSPGVPENTPGATVGTLRVSDADPNDQHQFTLSDPRFSISNGQLQLNSQVSLDYESEPEINLLVTATDPAGISISNAFTINVIDLNEPPTGILLTNASVMEETPGAVVGAVLVADPDAGDQHSLHYTIGDGAIDAGPFEFNGKSLRLRDGVSLDYETTPSIDIHLVVTDQAGLSYTAPFTIQVLDRDESKPPPQTPSKPPAFNPVIAGEGHPHPQSPNHNPTGGFGPGNALPLIKPAMGKDQLDLEMFYGSFYPIGAAVRGADYALNMFYGSDLSIRFDPADLAARPGEGAPPGPPPGAPQGSSPVADAAPPPGPPSEAPGFSEQLDREAKGFETRQREIFDILEKAAGLLRCGG